MRIKKEYVSGEKNPWRVEVVFTTSKEQEIYGTEKDRLAYPTRKAAIYGLWAQIYNTERGMYELLKKKGEAPLSPWEGEWRGEVDISVSPRPPKPPMPAKLGKALVREAVSRIRSKS